MKTCSKCGAENEEGNKFCIKCGSSLFATANMSEKKMTPAQLNKNPFIAVLLNLFLWGLGYWYLGIKKIYGFPWFFMIVFYFILYAIAMNDRSNMMYIALVVIHWALAYDVYQKAKGKPGWVPV